MDTSTLVQAINDAASQPASMSASEKIQLLTACNALTSSLETIEQKTVELLFGPVRAVAVRLGIDMHLFDVGAKALEKGETVTLQQLSLETKCEALLIKRVMRILVGMKMFQEVDQDVFQPLPMAAVFRTESPLAASVLHMTMTHLMQLFKLPDYFEERGYHCPTDVSDGPFQYARGTKLHIFEWLAEHPREHHAFNATMTMRTKQLDERKWFDVFPMGQLVAKQSSSDVFMVELGGGAGHNLVDLKERYPDIRGRLIVQDTASVITKINHLPPGVEAIAQDFFKPQSVHKADVYFVAHILHNWPDAQVKTILRNIRDAMHPESVLLLNETLMPERGAPFVLSVLDLMMLTGFSSLERTETQLRELLDDVGLSLIRVYSSSSGNSLNASWGQCVVEVRLASTSSS